MMGLMGVTAVRRPAESRALSDFLGSAAVRPSGQIIAGEAGIGKTTLWLDGLAQARERGFRVLSARVGQAESVMAYAAVADLIGDVETAVFDALPDLQRLALDRVLLRADGDGPETDHRVTAAAVVEVVSLLSADNPVLVAIDDVQWLDSSSRAVISFAAKRFRGRVGVLVTERTQPDTGTSASWLQLGDPSQLSRIQLGPLSLSAMQTLISERLGRTFPRPAMVRIADVSGGNPFYALELAREMGHRHSDASALPRTLADLVQGRIGRLTDETRNVLLVAASLSDPTVDVLARATGMTVDRVVELLAAPEDNGIVLVEGNRVRFAHPLLARGVYTDAAPARRRRVHRALAEVVTHPELQARHLALSTSSRDPRTLEALDAAAKAARRRGAPAAAAELLELAIMLGGDTPARRLRVAEHNVRGGDTRHAEAVLDPLIEQMPAGPELAEARLVRSTIYLNSDRYGPAAKDLKLAIEDTQDNLVILAQVRLMLSFAQARMARFEEALSNARQARTEAEQTEVPVLISSALANWVLVSFMCGMGFDEPSMRRALDLEDFNTEIAISCRASAVNAVVLTWTGQLEEAAVQMEAVRNRHLERGADTEMLFVSLNFTLLNLLRGKYRDAERDAADTLERTERVGGESFRRSTGLAIRGAIAVATGHEAEARADLYSALEAGLRSRSPMIGFVAAMLTALEVSLGNYVQALEVSQPLLANFDAIPGTEINTSAYLPDAIEALVMTGRLDDAVPFIEALETNGRRFDRAWMLAVGARCRSMLLAAQGDVNAAVGIAAQAMAEHDRLPIPLERARTQLLLGQLQRRQRQKQSAAATLTEALKTFETLGNPLWAARARAELERTNVSPGKGPELTPTERRVAKLAASGLTNRDIAAELFVSVKTVEANMSRIYRKLGIRSRAELGRKIDGGLQSG
jgi:DNA-binding CsgD family transcriptional regulator